MWFYVREVRRLILLFFNIKDQTANSLSLAKSISAFGGNLPPFASQNYGILALGNAKTYTSFQEYGIRNLYPPMGFETRTVLGFRHSLPFLAIFVASLSIREGETLDDVSDQKE